MLLSAETKVLSAPTLRNRDHTSITMEWPPVENALGYLIRYRSESERVWSVAKSPLTTNAVRKKGLNVDNEYYFSVQPLVDGEVWAWSTSSQPLTVSKVSCAALHPTACGYATEQGRLDWLSAHGITTREEQLKISQSLVADPNLDRPLYFWQLFSLLGRNRIFGIVRSFYERVYADNQERWFRDAFARISGIDHHVATQAAFWIDALGGGSAYHGGDYRLNFHHTHNAEAVMNAKGATRWMHHMTGALNDHEQSLHALDPRILPCLVDFLRTKMLKYAQQHGWKFENSDFDGLPTVSNT
jgi:truncated hemoglobin YjbI